MMGTSKVANTPANKISKAALINAFLLLSIGPHSPNSSPPNVDRILTHE